MKSTATTWCLAALLLGSLPGVSRTAWAGPQGLIDDFADSDLSEYTQTLVLDQNDTSNISFASPVGALQVSKSAGTEAEQVLFLRDDYTLDVGEILKVDLDWGTTTRADIGIAVAATATPTPLVYDPNTGGTQETREDYVAVYVQSDVGNIKTIGVNGTIAQPTIFASGTPIADRTSVIGLYIRRATSNDFVAGYSTTGGNINFAGWSLDNTDVGNAVGFFADARSVTTYGDLDNLRIVPEPATWALVLVGAAGLLCRAERKAAMN